jgi:hypothetical protein
MYENLEAMSTEQPTIEQVTAEEIAEVIAELEQYRERLINDTLATAKRAKVLKATALAQLEQHPEIIKIDAILQNLREQQAGGIA